MRAGIRDLLAPDADVAEIHAAVERAGQAAASRRRVLRPAAETDRYTGRVITIASPKGGVGKTTVSTNLALGLTAHAPQSTVLVDLDVQFGDCASALGLTPEYTLPDAVHGPASEDTMVLKTFLTQHPSGLYAVCGSESPAAGTRSAARTSPGCWPRWRGSSATSSSTPRPACPRRPWRPWTGRPTS